MSSPGVMHARKFEPVEWMPLDAQESRAYPASYEEARCRLVTQLLSMPAASLEETKPAVAPRDPIAGNPDFELSRDRECADQSVRDDRAGGKQRQFEQFRYISSFDRLTSRRRKTRMQPAPVRAGVHLLNVLTVTAGFVVGAFVYASLGGGFPGLSAGVRSFLGDPAAKVRLILPGHDVGNSPAAPVPPPSVKEASAERAPPTNTGSTDHLLYSTASIAFTPLK
jgi:hypothetical protein